VHFGVIALAAQLAVVDVDGTPVPPPPDTIVFHLAPAPARTSTGPTTGEQGGSDTRRPPTTPVELPTAPVTVPIEIPPVDPAAPVIDGSTDWLSESARRSLTSGGDTAGRGAESRPRRGAIAIAERGALALPGNPRPRYPEVLRAAALAGTVLAEFVVDTSGAIEMATVQIIASDHPLFERAVRDILPHLRFLPAEAGGRKVGQLVRQPFEFRLARVPR
jgi:protein TonB